MDLTALLGDWPFEPGTFVPRVITSQDGRELLQVRLELGVLQMERFGRPDGQRPHGLASMLEAVEALEQDTPIAPEIARALRDEIGQYDSRSMVLLALRDLPGVAADAAHMIRCIEAGLARSEVPEVREMLEPVLPRAITLHARAVAEAAMEQDDARGAREAIERGLAHLKSFMDAATFEHSTEVGMLHGMHDGLIPRLPSSQRAELEQRLRDAIAGEHYELAVILRNELRLL